MLDHGRRNRQGGGVRKIGLLGGMSWESTALYYSLLNELVRERLGGFHSARCVISSVDFAPVEEMQRAGDWDAAGALLAAEARVLEDAGAELLLLCTNTMHKVADRIEEAISVEFVHLADVTARAVLGGRAGIRRLPRDRLQHAGALPDRADREPRSPGERAGGGRAAGGA